MECGSSKTDTLIKSLYHIVLEINEFRQIF